MRLKPSLPLLLLIPALLLAACSTPSPAPAVTDTPEATRTSAPSLTPVATQTIRPTITAVPPTATETALPSATPEPTLNPALADLKLIGLAWYGDYDLLLSFQFPESITVDPTQYRVMLEDKEYNCEVLAQFPHRLYCKGQGAAVLKEVQVRLYPAGSDQAAFEKDVWIPYFNNRY